MLNEETNKIDVVVEVSRENIVVERHFQVLLFFYLSSLPISGMWSGNCC